ncbi:hypothetical protein vseg_014341 [Gypsophila vaccaria]
MDNNKEQSCSNYGLVVVMENNGYLQPNYWPNNNNQNNEPLLFESTLTSVVSSPSSSPYGGSGGGGVMINELIGRLGSIVHDSNARRSSDNSCYSTPLHSPPLSSSKFDFSSLMNSANNNNISLGCLNDDFVERAAKFSCFGNNNNNIINVDVGRSISRVNSEKKMNDNNNNTNTNVNNYDGENNNGESRESSSVSEQKYSGVEMTCKLQNDGNNNNSRKRKSIPKAKLKVENEESDAKRSKLSTELNQKKNAEDRNNNNSSKVKENNINNKNNNKDSNENNNNNNDKNNNESKAEPPKDYIHVRARRGQATDSHSLAERVRREKISERMKFLQDLVPGCNKVTGKATVLDEIINYVQSLQRQVEFLSMKLSTVNPRAEFNMDALLSKDMFESRGSQMSQTMYQLDQNSAQEFPYVYQTTQQIPLSFPNGLENPFSLSPMNVADIRRNPNNGPTPSINGFVDSLAQLPTLWEDDLQSIVQMGIVPNQTQSVPGTLLPNGHMKVEP